jgi:hypothetical protein
MEVDKKIALGLAHIYEFFKKNKYDEVEALFTLSVTASMISKTAYERSKDNDKLDTVFKDFKQLF